MQEITIRLNKDLSKSNLVSKGLWKLRKKVFTAQLPDNWAEVPKEHFIDAIAPLMIRQFSSEENEGKILIKVAQNLLDLPALIFNSIPADAMYDNICRPLEWILSEPLLEPYIDSFVVDKQSYSMPLARLENCKLHEFINADTQYMKLLKEGGWANIDNLVAILVREDLENPDEILRTGDKRVPLLKLGLEERTKKLSKLSAAKKFYVLYFFSCCKQSIFDSYAEAFDKGTKKWTSRPKPITETYWEDVITDVAESGVFGSYKEILEINVHVFFRWLKKISLKETERAKKEFQSQIADHHKKFVK